MPKIKTLDALLTELSQDKSVTKIDVYGHYGRDRTNTIKLELTIKESALPGGAKAEGKWEFQANTARELIEIVQKVDEAVWS